MGKSLLTSKTFWTNVLGIAVTYAGILPPDVAAVVIAVANLALRLITTKPITSII